MKVLSRKTLSRRTFLRGSGASLALPFLDAMIPALAADAARPPLRLGYIYLPIGRIMEDWTPTRTGREFEITPSLEPLAGFRDDMLLVSGLDIKAADLLPGEKGGTHARPSAAYLTGVHPYNNSVGISVDQVVAKAIRGDTPLASLELGLDPAEWAGGNEVDYDGFYRSTISWRTATTPLPTENDPRKVFERLFGDTDSLDSETTRRRILRQTSILDVVNARARALMASVDASDRYRLEEYFDGVREIERRIQIAEARDARGETAALDGFTRPAGIPDSYAEHAKLILDMMFLAYRTNMTRVVAFMFGHEGTNRNYLELGAQDGHHSLSHHKGDTQAIDLLRKIDRHQSELLAAFLERMRATREIDGSSLLENSIIIAGSALSDGNNHLHNDVPIAIFGQAQGRVGTGRHLRFDAEPLSNLHLAVLDMFGAPADEYLSNDTSDATGILPGLG
ncbi:MAG: DUF1552 domain-containing protein [Woeseiaceae bacterium]|nr:DUF1552 domain-containing protein [Woeseiaceae bacterium]